MAETGDVIEGPAGFRLRLLRTSADTDGELLEMEATYGPGSALPPEHLHPNQDERFEVLRGAVTTIIGGEEQRFEAGESFDVPAGTPHQMTGDGPALVIWQVRPALRTAEFFEGLYAGARASEAGKVFDFVAYLEEHSAEIRFT